MKAATRKKPQHEVSLTEELLRESENDIAKKKQPKRRKRTLEESVEEESEPRARRVAFQQRIELAKQHTEESQSSNAEEGREKQHAETFEWSSDEEEEDRDELYPQAEFPLEEGDYTLTAEEEECLRLFDSEQILSSKVEIAEQGPTLADIILQKMKDFEESRNSLADSSRVFQISDKVRELYVKVGEVLKHYRSGKVPKALKVLPAMSNWDRLLGLTRPKEWSSVSVFIVTKLFIANLKSNEAQRFCSWVLLPRIHEEVKTKKKLNFHLYRSLKKALFKPEAFFKGIIFPLCESGECSAREAVIIGSVLLKTSVPLLHAASGLLKLSSYPYSPAIIILIRILLEKRYVLPSKAVEGVYEFFLSEENGKMDKLTVLWFQTLLIFVRLYGSYLSGEQKTKLKRLVSKHFHPGISPEIKVMLNKSETKEEDASSMPFD
eukprot:jgi/Galph1/3588/GphlegSOOS_G2277.1